LIAVLLVIGSLPAAAAAPEIITADRVEKVALTGQPGFNVAFAPDFVGCDIPRRFMIELEFPGDPVPTALGALPPQVKFLAARDLVQELKDLPKRKLRRLYFETVSPGRASIEITAAGGSAVVPVTVWGYEDLRRTRTVNGVTFPRRYPVGGSMPFVKQKQTLPPLAPGSVAEPVKIGGFTAKRINYHEPFVAKDYTLEEMWQMAPDTSFTVRKPFPSPPDPVHGDKIYQASGDPFYCYKIPPLLPGKKHEWFVYSPVDGSRIPDNDYINGDFSGTYVDDGINGAEFNGQRHYYIGQIAVMRALQLYDMVAQTANLYAATGEVKYAQLALVGLARIGVEHNMLSVLCQNRRAHLAIDQNRKLVESVPFERFGNSGFFIDGIWTTGEVQRMAVAYDRIFPYIAAAQPVLDFLQARKLPVRTADELKRFIEENVFLTYLQGQLDGICKSNYPHAPQTYAQIVGVLDYPTTEWIDRIYAEGMGEAMFLRRFWREGFKDESPGGYNNLGLSTLYRVFSMTEAILNENPQLFPEDKYPRPTRNPRFVSGAKALLKHVTTPYTAIAIGDGPPLTHFTDKTKAARRYVADDTPEFFEDLFRTWRTPEIAWALLHTDYRRTGRSPALPELQAAAAKLAPDWRTRADDLSGPGIAILRGGRGDDERAMYMHYGFLNHGHDSAMGIYLDALKNRLVTGWGYPAKLDRWYYHWMGNNTGRTFPADGGGENFPHRWRSANGDLYGWSEFAVTSGRVQAAGARAAVIGDVENPPLGDSFFKLSPDDEQSRTVGIVNAGERDFYLIDFYRIKGGREHWRSFGTLDGKAEVKSLPLTAQPGGTLAGADIEYNDMDWVARHGGGDNALGFVRIRNVERGVAAQPFEVRWALNDGDGAFVRLLALESDRAEIALGDAADHNRIYPYVRRMLFWHHRVKPGQFSRVFNLIEAGRGEELIVKAIPLVTDTPNSAAAQINLRGGRTDLVLVADAAGPHRAMLPDGRTLTLDGRFGLVSLNADGTVAAAHLIYGKSLDFDRLHLAGTPAYAGKIVAVDAKNWTMDVAPAFTHPEQLTGRNLTVDRYGFKFALEIVKAENVGETTRLTVGCAPVSGIYQIAGHRDGMLIFQENSQRGAPGTARVAPMQYRRQGMALYGKSGALYRTQGFPYDDPTVTLLGESPERLKAEVLAKEFPLGSTVRMYDYAPGMKVEVPLSAER
jgi:hypothetical protein